MKYSLMISAALLMAIGHTQPASAQQLNPIDLVKLGVEAQGGADALRAIKTLVQRATPSLGAGPVPQRQRRVALPRRLHRHHDGRLQ